MIHHSSCPVCKSAQLKKELTAIDYTVSAETFEIWHCKNCTLKFTQDIPDSASIGRYYQSADYISHSDTKKGIVNRLYHIVRNLSLSGKRKLIKKKTGLKNGKLLDVGCGTGAFLNTMQQSGWQVHGLEPDEQARKKAKELYGMEPLPSDKLFELEPESFDAITLWHVLEHVHRLGDYIVQLRKLLKPSGILLIAVPNYTAYDAQHYKQYWAAYDVPRHLYHFSPQSMQVLMNNHQLKISNKLPMWFDSFYVSMLSEKYRTGKLRIIRAFFTGLCSNFITLTKHDRCSSLIYVMQKKS